MNKQELKILFPIFSEIELIENIAEHSLEKSYEAGDVVIRKGEYMKYMPLVISGSIKIIREDETGNEVLLYYLEGGNTCAMSITCCMKEEKSKVQAVAEKDTKILMIPVWVADNWIKKYTSWKNFIMNSYSKRLEQLLYTLDSIAFHSLDERLIKYLKDKCSAISNPEFEITHSGIATELNSSREAISRLLKKLETLGKVTLGRNKIKIINL